MQSLEWPTAWTPIFIFLSISIIGFSFFRYRKRAKLFKTVPALTIFLFIQFVGYHFSPLMHYRDTTPWTAYMLVRENIDTAMLLANAAMISMALGFEAEFRSNSVRRLIAASGKQAKRLGLIFSGASSYKLLLIAAFIVGLTIKLTLADSGAARGDMQWLSDADNWTLKFYRMLSVALTVLSVVLGAVGLASITRSEKIATATVLEGLAFLIVGSLNFANGFSRASGLLLVLGGLAIVVKRGISPKVIGLLIVYVGLFLGDVGLQYRHKYKNNIPNFGMATIEHASNRMDSALLGRSRNHVYRSKGKVDLSSRFSAIPAVTKLIEMRDANAPSVKNGPLSLITSLHPFPSRIIGVNHGVSLSKAMGTVGRTGLPPPSLGQGYYLSGWLLPIIYFALGMVLAGITSVFNETDTLSVVVILLCVAGLFVGLHSPWRAMTRPILYSFAICVIASASNLTVRPATTRGSVPKFVES